MLWRFNPAAIASPVQSGMKAEFKTIVVLCVENEDGSHSLTNSDGSVSTLFLVSDLEQKKRAEFCQLAAVWANAYRHHQSDRVKWLTWAQAKSTAHRMRVKRFGQNSRLIRPPMDTWAAWGTRSCRAAECKAYRWRDGGWLAWAQGVSQNYKKRKAGKDDRRNKSDNQSHTNKTG